MKITRRAALAAAPLAAFSGAARAGLLQTILLSGKAQGFPAPGLVGLWYMDRYQAAPRPHVPNAAAGGAVPQNLISAPRRVFATSLWGRTSCTATDNFAVGPDGLTEASRLQVNADTDGYLYSVFSGGLPSGTYTVRCAIKSNTGASQSFRFGDIAGSMDTAAATTSWQVFAKTFAGWSGARQPGIRTADSASPALDLLVCDFGVYPGSLDLGPDTLSGAVLLGRTAYDSSLPAYTAGALQYATNRYSIAQFAASNGSWSSATMIVLAAKTAGAHTGNEWGFGNNSPLIVGFENAGPFSYFGGDSMYTQNNGGATTPRTSSSLWDDTFLNLGWSAFGLRYDAGQGGGDAWLDDLKMFSRTVALPSQKVEDFFCGFLNNGASALFSDYKIGAIALWNRALSDAEYRQAYGALVARIGASGNSIAPKRIYVAEGDSITVAPTISTFYPLLAAASFSPVCQGFDNAVTGSGVADCLARQAAVNGRIPPNPGSRKFILSLLIGHDDQGSPTYLTDLAALCDGYRKAGWKLVLCTLTPSTVSGFSAWRATANTEIRLWTTGGSIVSGIHADAICDFAADPTMGPDSAASNTSLYSDGTHPTATGAANLAAVLAPVINGL
jgi:hypothetical protein